jgi:hypothetical protein
MGDVRFEADVEKKAPIVKEERGEKKLFGLWLQRDQTVEATEVYGSMC